MTDDPRLQISIGHVVGKPANIQFRVMMTAWIAAADEYVAAPVASHIRERNGLIVKHQVRDGPGHAALKRGLSGNTLVSGPRSIPGGPLRLGPSG